jgi:nuclear GTP-binding protein
VLSKTKPQHIERTYALRGYKDHIEFLEMLARKGGRLLHGGEPDLDGVAKMVLNDFLRGKIPWFTPPPVIEGEEADAKGVDGRLGKLGEMGKKRKRDDAESTVAESEVADTSMADAAGSADDFEGFGSGDEIDMSDDGMPDSDSEVEGGVELEDDDEDEEDEQENEEDDEDEEDLDTAITEQIRETLKSNPKTRDTVRIPTPNKQRRTKR